MLAEQPSETAALLWLQRFDFSLSLIKMVDFSPLEIWIFSDVFSMNSVKEIKVSKMR